MSDLDKEYENIVDERTDAEIESEKYEADIAFAVQEAVDFYKNEVA